MTRNMAKAVHSDAAWEAANAEGKAALAECARAKDNFEYGLHASDPLDLIKNSS